MGGGGWPETQLWYRSLRYIESSLPAAYDPALLSVSTSSRIPINFQLHPEHHPQSRCFQRASSS